jgi:uncharacterized membrane protein YfhO
LKTKATLVFSENFDSGWEAKIANQKIASQKVYDRLNSFPINKTGNFEVIVEFTPQKYVNLGLIISGVVLLISIILLLVKLPI